VVRYPVSAQKPPAPKISQPTPLPDSSLPSLPIATRVMNPSIPEAFLADAYADDPARLARRSFYLRDGLRRFFRSSGLALRPVIPRRAGQSTWHQLSKLLLNVR
jgi:hypothetical protein